MDELGVIEQPELEVAEQETPETPEAPETPQPEQQEGESDRKFSQRFSAWLKGIRDTATDPEIAKFARAAKDSYSHMYSLKEMFPTGVDGARELKATVDGLQYGEFKGAEAIGAIQDKIQDYEMSDDMLAAGDRKVLDAFGPEFDEGLAKLTPTLIDRMAQSNPQAYAAAILPHLVNNLTNTPLLQGMGQIATILNEQPPTWLTPDQKTNWINDKFQKIVQSFNGAATWWDAQVDASKNAPKPAQNGQIAPRQDEVVTREQQQDQRERDFHWKTNIAPDLDKHALKSFDDLFRSYNQRLKLPPETIEGLKKDFVARVVEKAGQNRQYMSQIQRYRGQKNPDPATVLNLARVEFDKHSKGVIQGLIDERYRNFLGSKQAPTPRATNGTFTANGTGPRVVSVKPNPAEIDFHNTPVDWLNTKADGSKQYMMKDGKTVIFRPNR